ncbi:MAG: DNA-binding protein WhiA [Candidatus Avispirillum sp.]
MADTEKKNCCRRMLSDMLSLENGGEDTAEKISASPDHFKCSNCFSAFLKGIFIVYGSVTDPAKRYHLELSFPTENIRDAAGEIIDGHGFVMSRGSRKGRYLLYIKDSGKIEEFFALIGANKAAFELINSKIVKELREDTNRQLNCDMANIKKSLSASKHITEIIQHLYDSGAITALPADLKETARLRAENDQATLSELALMHSVPMTKSGVKHRLDKIAEFAREIEERENRS